MLFTPTSTCRVKSAVLWLAALSIVPLAASCTATAPAGKKLLTLEAIYGPQRINPDGTYARGLQWLPDGRHYLERREDLPYQVDAVSGEATPAYDHEALEAALRKQGDFDEGAAPNLARHPTLFSEDRRVVILQHNSRLYAYWFDLPAHELDGKAPEPLERGTAEPLKRLTEEPADRRVITLSPDNARVAFVKDNNLFTIDLATAQETALTQDGSETLLNGYLDWVYQEEVYGRGNWRSHWWSKDGRYLAYLQLDERDVPVYPLVDHLHTHPILKPLRYPKPGDPNPKVRLGVVPAAGGPTVWVDLSKYGTTDIIICEVGWSPAGRLIYCVKDRESRWLELVAADPQTGASTMLIREACSAGWTPAYGPPHWLKDGSFLWTAARDGWAHLYHHAADGQLICRVTEGKWEVRKLHGVDAETGWIYITGTRDSHLEEHAYRVRLTGGEIQRLTEPGSTHNPDFDPQCRYFIDTFSNLTTPPKVQMRRSNGELVRVISANEVPVLAQYALSPPQIVHIPTPRGYTLSAELIRPLHVRPGRRYPVFSFIYGGPHAPSVHRRWGGREFLFKQLLAQKGYIVWTCDPYSASGEGEVSAWNCYKRLGVTEVADLEEGLRWLGQHEPADLSRVGILGHSYGGFMASYALTHSKMFKIGIAASSVTDWRNYDTIYTETFMLMPQNNPDGYQQSSVLAAAKDLHGRLLVVHGMVDDNVHVNNSLELIDALEKAGIGFDLMIYPSDAHGIGAAAWHWQKLRLEFIERNL